MLLEHGITISAFFKIEMAKCHPLGAVASYKTGIHTEKLQTLSKIFSG